MSSVNKVILVGNCGRDPEVRYLPSGSAVANVSIATSSRRKDRSSGETIEDTQWHRITFFDKLAEIAGEYLKKGKTVYIEGSIKYGSYTDKNGVEKNTVEIVASSMQMLGGRDAQGSSQGRGDDRGASQPQPQPQRSVAAPAPAAAPRPQTTTASGFDDMDDDIPF